MSPRSSAYVYLGPTSDHHWYHCLDLITQRVIIAHHVMFDEYHFPFIYFHLTMDVSVYDPFLSNDVPSPLSSTHPISVTHIIDASSVVPVNSPTDLSLSPTSSLVPTPPPHLSHPMVKRSHTGSLRSKKIFNLAATTDVSYSQIHCSGSL